MFLGIDEKYETLSMYEQQQNAFTKVWKQI